MPFALLAGFQYVTAGPVLTSSTPPFSVQLGIGQNLAGLPLPGHRLSNHPLAKMPPSLMATPIRRSGSLAPTSGELHKAERECEADP